LVEWAAMAIERPFTPPVLQELFTNHELLFRETHRPKEPGPDGVRSVGILGGGTAGWLTALALRTHLPWLEVSVIETPTLPVIGVGEATVPSFVAFLHHYLKLEVHHFTRSVRPTWKQGIRFEWGQPGDYVFQAPFDWEANGIGMLGSMADAQNVSHFTLGAHLMARGKTAILRQGNQLQSFLPILPFAYHLDNPRLVDFLSQAALARGVRREERKIAAAEVVAAPGDSDPHIGALVAEDGEKLRYDFYVDCSGFRSFLLEKTLESPFVSFADSLPTDRALAFNAAHGGDVQAYTTARTMNAGWCWTIPMVDDNHHGYVYASSHCSDDEARAEVLTRWPSIDSERIIHFRSGRHDRPWIGNVFAIGNSYAFVEPLESTGLMMIQRAISALVYSFPIGPSSQTMRGFVNSSTARDWDRLRWFLAAHYKFNRRLDTAFWKDVRENADISGLERALAIFQSCGPLSLLPRALQKSLDEEVGVFFYGLAGLDCILLGQKVPHPTLTSEPLGVWRKRQKLAQDFARRGLRYPEALRAIEKRPELLEQVVTHPTGWVVRMSQLL
jgi:tryptophan 7-halogenase